MKALYKLAGVASLALLAGCMTQPVAIAPSSKPLTKGKYTVIGPATGRAVGFMVFGIPLSEPRQAGKARDRALEAAGGDALINIAVDMTMINLFLGSIMITTLTGDAVKVQE